MKRLRQRDLFRGRVCVYCHGQADTRDHVPPRCLHEEPYPPNLMTVDSCQECNGGSSEDEEYFHAVLAQVGTVPSLLARVSEGGSVDRSLEHSPGLDALITASLAVGEDGLVYLNPDFGRLNRVARKVAVGLYHRRYRRLPPPAGFAALGVFQARRLLPCLLALNLNTTVLTRPWQRFQPHVFEYAFVRDAAGAGLTCVMNFHDTLWAAVGCPSPSGRKPA